MQDSTQAAPSFDAELLDAFDKEVGATVPHLQADGKVEPTTPLVDLTQTLREAAREEYGLELPSGPSSFTVFGKLEARLPGGSVKTRPAVQIVRAAIASGRLRRGQVVFEATSGNFGIALGQLAKLGIQVVALVSRKLQEGVLEGLERSGVKTVDLDVDICPAPGVQMDPNLLVARLVATNVRERLREIGLEVQPFDDSRQRVEELLGRQDVINLAKLLAEVYGGFCPAQYENELNPGVHQAVTGPEIDEQLRALGRSLSDSSIVCAFGTGGTSTGLSRYMQAMYGRKAVRVIFPQEGQDVAGIRTRSKAAGLAFYQPAMYAGMHDVDFNQAKRLLVRLAEKDHLDLGESSALMLYSVIQMVNFGVQGNFVVILADGISKYTRDLRKQEERGEKKKKDEEGLEGKMEVTVEQARDHIDEYGAVVWTHPGYRPNDEGEKLVLSQVGAEGHPFEVVPAIDVARAVTTGQLPQSVLDAVEKYPGRTLLVCMAGSTSLRMAQLLSQRGIKSQSLTGGISNLARVSRKPVLGLVQPAS